MRRLGSLWLFVAAITTLGQGGGPEVAQLPATPVMATMPTFKAVSGPGAMFPALQPLPPDGELARFKYVTKEYFVSGIAQGQPYTTRVVVRRPVDSKKFSGIVVAEPMHPTGNDWMFYFMHTLPDDAGSRCRGDRYRQSSAVQYRQRGTLQGSRDRKYSGQRNPGPGGVAAEERSTRRAPRRIADAQDDPDGHVGVGRGGRGLSSGAHGVSRRRNETDLRRVPSDKHRWRQHNHESGCAGRADADDDGSRPDCGFGQSISPARRRCTGRSVPHL